MFEKTKLKLKILKEANDLKQAGVSKDEAIKTLTDKYSAVADVKFIIGLVIAVYFIAYLIPGSITAIVNGCSSAWPTGVQAIWIIMPLLIIVIIVYRLYKEVEG